MTSIGSKLKIKRKQKKLTQAELADGLVDRSYISQIEKGIVTPSYKTIVSLAKRLGEDISYFIEEQEVDLLTITDIQRKLKNAIVYIELNEWKKAEENILKISEEYLIKLDLRNKGLYYWVLGEVLLYNKDLEKSIGFLRQSRNILEVSGRESDLIKCLNSLSKAYMNNNKNEEALGILTEASYLLIKNQINNGSKIEVLLNMAVCHGKIGEFHSAIRLCKEAIYINSMTNTNYKSGELFMTLGICYKMSGDLKKALEYYLKAEKFFKIFESKFNLAGTLINLGILFRETQEFKVALNFIERAKILFQELNDEYQVCNCYVELVRTYISHNNYSIAKELAFESIRLIPENFLYLRKQVFEALSDIFLAKNEPMNSLDYLERAEELTQKSPDIDLTIKKAQIYLKMGDFKVAAELFSLSLTTP